MGGDADRLARERISALDRLVQSELKRLDEALVKFEESVAQRFVAGNEFRQSLNDVQREMATRRELEAFQNEYRNAHTDLLQIVSDLRTNIAVGPTELKEFLRNQQQDKGRHSGVNSTTALFLTIGGLVVTAAWFLVTIYFSTHP